MNLEQEITNKYHIKNEMDKITTDLEWNLIRETGKIEEEFKALEYINKLLERVR